MMNQGELIGKVHNSMYQQIKKNGFATPVQVLMDVGALSKEDYERWRFGKIDYLERVYKINLSKLSFIMREIRAYARKNGLKESWTLYKRWGLRGKSHSAKLWFSKSREEQIEKAYASHYVDSAVVAEMKAKQEASNEF